MKRRAIPISIFIIAASLVGVSYFNFPFVSGFDLSSAGPGDKQPVLWTPRALGLALVTGDSQVQRLTLNVKAKKRVPTILRLEPSAEIAPYILSLTPTDIEVPPNTNQQLNIVFTAAAPLNSLPSTIKGTIQVQVSKKGEFRTKKKFSLPVTVTVIGIPAPSDWSIRLISPSTPQERIIEGSGVSATSPLGSSIILYPFGVPGFGLDPETEILTTNLNVDGFPAIRTDYSIQGQLLISIVEVSSVPEYPNFSILLRPSKTNPEELVILEKNLDGLQLPGGD